MQKEIWKDVSEYKGIYQISRLGLVKSLERMRLTKGRGICKVKERILKSALDRRGYSYVILCKNGIKKSNLIHRLIGIAFIPNPENKSQINHKNGIKIDCWVGNLEWMTCSENHFHAFRTGLRISNLLGKFGKDHHRSKTVLQYDLQDNFITEYGSIREAERKTSIKHSNISSVCLGSQKTAGGYKWVYKI